MRSGAPLRSSLVQNFSGARPSIATLDAGLGEKPPGNLITRPEMFGRRRRWKPAALATYTCGGGKTFKEPPVAECEAAALPNNLGGGWPVFSLRQVAHRRAMTAGARLDLSCLVTRPARARHFTCHLTSNEKKNACHLLFMS